MEKVEKQRKSGRKQFTPEDFDIMCDWLEFEENLKCVLGSGGKTKKTKIGLRYPTRKRTFEAMATFINEQQPEGTTLATLDGQGARNRFNHLYEKYKKVKPEVESTEWGLTLEDEANGIHTIQAKLDKLCPCFGRLDAMFGENPSVNIKQNLLLPWTDPLPASTDASVEPEVVTNDNHASLDQPSLQCPLSTPMGSSQIPTGRPGSALVSPVSDEEPPENFPDPSLQSGTTVKVTGVTSSKQKLNKISSYPSKKRAVDRVQSLAGAFAMGLEATSQRKGKSNDVHFAWLEADRTMRAEASQKQLEIEAKKLNLEEQKLKIQARIQVINGNSHRSPEEIKELLTMLD